MDPVGGIISILGLTHQVLGHFLEVRDAPRHIRECGIELSCLHNLLVRLNDQLVQGNFDKPWYTNVQALTVKDGPLDQYKESLETLKKRLPKKFRLSNVKQVLMWPFDKEEIQGVLNKIERLKSLIETALLLDNFKLSQAIKDDTQMIPEHLPRMSSNIEEMRNSQSSEDHRKLMDWISPLNYPAQQADIIKRMHKGTLTWFLESSELSKWKDEPKATLLCLGIPGAGKTLLAASAVDHIRKTSKSDPHGLAFLFLNHKDKQDVTSLLAALTKQLVQSHPSLTEFVKGLHHRHEDKETRPSLQEHVSALDNTLSHFPAAYIVIDALDESQDDLTRKELIDLLTTLQLKHDLHLLVTSRPLPGIIEQLKNSPRLEVRASNSDVKSYVEAQIPSLPTVIQENNELQEYVQSAITKAANGMFLLARLHIDSLRDKKRTTQVKSTLRSFAQSSNSLEGVSTDGKLQVAYNSVLRKAYGDALERIKCQGQNDHELAKQVLSWITFAKRPLTTHELCCALAVEEGNKKFDPGNEPLIEDAVSVCAGLVIVDEQSKIVRLVHYTTQEYFENLGGSWDPLARERIAMTCLTYLSFPRCEDISACCSEGKTSEDNDDEKSHCHLRKWSDDHIFLRYAFKYWDEHIRTVEAEVCERVCVLLNDYHLRHLLEDDHLRRRFPSGERPDTLHYTSFHIAAQYGLIHIMDYLISGVEGDARDPLNRIYGRGESPLILAIYGHHDDMVQLLITNGAATGILVDGTIAEPRSLLQPLYRAIEYGSSSIIRLLVQGKVDATSLNDGEWTVNLDRFCVSLVKYLLDQGVSLDVLDEWAFTSCLELVGSGNEPAVSLLLDGGYNVNTKYAYQGGITVLHLAASCPNLAIVKLLLQKNANPNLPCNEGRSSLHYAVEGSLDPPFSSTAQQAAGLRRSLAIIDLLVAAGAEINAQDSQQQTALHIACMYGTHQVGRKLLSLGADAASTDIRGATIIHLAAESKDFETLYIMIDNAKARKLHLETSLDTSGNNVLHYLLHGPGSSGEMVDFLLREGVDGSKANHSGVPPLAWYFKKWEHGAEYFVNGNKNCRWFYRGSEVNIDVCRSLLQTSQDAPLYVDGDGQNFGHLYAAAIKLDVKSLRVFQEYGVDLTKRDAHNRTLLHHAAISGHVSEKALDYLCEEVGLDICGEDCMGKTAVQYAIGRLVGSPGFFIAKENKELLINGELKYSKQISK